MHLEGGCFHYSNQIIAHMRCCKEIWVPRKRVESANLKNYKTLLYWGYPTCIRLLSLAVFLLWRLFRAIIGRYSALLLFGYCSWDYYIMKVWKLTGLPSFFIVHDGKMHDGESNGKLQRQLVEIMRNATHLIFLSEYVRELVKTNFKIEKPYLILPHGLINYGKLHNVARTDPRPTLLFLGRVSKYKGVDLLLESIKQIPDDKYNKLIIAGKWNDAVPLEYNNQKVEIVDKWLSSDEIIYYLSVSDIMVFPYVEATQSGVATLAINYLKPSIVTNVGAFSEQFNKESVIYVKPTVEDIAKGINILLNDEHMYKVMQGSLRELKRKYSWNVIVADFEKKLLSIISNKNGNNYPPHSVRECQYKEWYMAA